MLSTSYKILFLNSKGVLCLFAHGRLKIHCSRRTLFQTDVVNQDQFLAFERRLFLLSLTPKNAHNIFFKMHVPGKHFNTVKILLQDQRKRIYVKKHLTITNKSIQITTSLKFKNTSDTLLILWSLVRRSRILRIKKIYIKKKYIWKLCLHCL